MKRFAVFTVAVVCVLLVVCDSASPVYASTGAPAFLSHPRRIS